MKVGAYCEMGLHEMGVERWKTGVWDVTEWASVMREVKAKLIGLYC